ncbi:hypothetical protein KAW18_02580 [candidate division WOR-3 bacterium]|nr:hypothetical protein [candidate division WOR-3 bacterium]
MKGILTSLASGDTQEVILDYVIETEGNRRIFKLIGGPIGYESFYIDDKVIERIGKNGWTACMGTKYVYDRLFIPADEMRKALGGKIKWVE